MVYTKDKLFSLAQAKALINGGDYYGEIVNWNKGDRQN